MKIKKKMRERNDRPTTGTFKSLFLELNGQLQSYISALKTTTPEQR